MWPTFSRLCLDCPICPSESNALSGLKSRLRRGVAKRANDSELDGYCEEVGVAFEYQGEQHYDKNHCYHKKHGDFEILQANDTAKVRLCADNGVRLVVVPCSVRSTQLVKFIKDALSKLGMDFHADLALTNDVITQRRIVPVIQSDIIV